MGTGIAQLFFNGSKGHWFASEEYVARWAVNYVFTPSHSQGGALGWENGRAFGPSFPE
jgi:hypothetical protein